MGRCAVFDPRRTLQGWSRDLWSQVDWNGDGLEWRCAVCGSWFGWNEMYCLLYVGWSEMYSLCYIGWSELRSLQRCLPSWLCCQSRTEYRRLQLMCVLTNTHGSERRPVVGGVTETLGTKSMNYTPLQLGGTAYQTAASISCQAFRLDWVPGQQD